VCCFGRIDHCYLNVANWQRNCFFLTPNFKTPPQLFNAPLSLLPTMALSILNKTRTLSVKGSLSPAFVVLSKTEQTRLSVCLQGDGLMLSRFAKVRFIFELVSGHVKYWRSSHLSPHKSSTSFPYLVECYCALLWKFKNFETRTAFSYAIKSVRFAVSPYCGTQFIHVDWFRLTISNRFVHCFFSSNLKYMKSFLSSKSIGIRILYQLYNLF